MGSAKYPTLVIGHCVVFMKKTILWHLRGQCEKLDHTTIYFNKSNNYFKVVLAA